MAAASEGRDAGGQAESSRPLVAKERTMWLFQQFVADAGVLNVPLAFTLSGGVDMPALRAAVAALVRRHPALRTLFPTVDGEPRRVTLAADDPRTRVRLRARATHNAGLRRELAATASAPFDLSVELPIRVVVHSTEHDDVVCVVVNHLAYDAYSARVLERELLVAYEGLLGGRQLPAGLAEPVPAPDLADGSAESLAYWRDSLADLPRSAGGMAMGRPGPRAPSFPGSVVRRALAPAAWAAIEEVARRTSSLPSAVLLAAFGTVLARHGAGDDFVVGVPYHGRGLRPHQAIGYYVTIAPVRLAPRDDVEFDRLVRQCAAGLLASLQHSDVPVDQVAPGAYQDDGGEGGALIRYLFNFVADLPAPENGALRARLGVRPVEVPLRHSRLDVDLAVTRDGDQVRLRAVHAADVLSEAEAAALLARLETVLTEAAAGGRTVGEIPLWSAADRNAVGAASGPAPELPSLVEDVLTSAFAAPAAPAVVCPNGTVVDYAGLATSAEAVAADLADHGVPPGSRVAVAARAPVDLGVAVLGCWAARCCAVVLDPDRPIAAQWPPGTAAPAALLADRSDRNRPAGGRPPAVLLPIRREAGGMSGPLYEPPHPDDVAMLWPSAPGAEEWAAVTHRGLALAVARLSELLALSAGDRVGWGPTATSGPHWLDPLAAWRVGAAVLPVPDAGEDAALAAVAAGATVLPVSPLVCERLLDRQPGGRPLRAVVRGDRLVVGLDARAARAGVSVVRVLAWPAATGLAAAGPLSAVSSAGYAGRRIPGVPTRVVDPGGRALPPGVRGRLRVGEPLAAAAGPDGPSPTGPLVRWGFDGSVEVADAAGAAADLDVEQALEAHQAVRRAAVVRSGDTLVAHVELRDGSDDTDEAALVSHVAGHLGSGLAGPDLPSVICRTLPLDPLGGVDSAQLARLPVPTARRLPEASADELGIDLVGLWRTLLNKPALGAHDNFFAQGGDSLLAAQLVSRIKKQTGQRVSLRTVFAAPTPAALGRELLASRSG